MMPKISNLSIDIVSTDELSFALPIDLLLPSELSILETKSLNHKNPWLLGRLAAKKAVLEQYSNHLEIRAYTDICIHNDQTGRPFVTFPEFPELPTPLMSISHTSEYGVACAANKNNYHSVGIDIESVRLFSEETLQAFLTDTEQAFLCNSDPSSRQTLATRYWCCKEAYLKAIGTGLRNHPKEVEICFENSTNRATVAHSGVLTSFFIYYTSLTDTHILCLAYHEKL